MQNSSRVTKGEKFGALTVIKPKVWRSTARKWYATVQCACGHVKDVQENNLISGNSSRCGNSCPAKPPHANALPCGVAAMRNRYSRYKTNAKERGLAFSITVSQFNEITQRECYYCGLQPTNVARVRLASRTGDYVYSGLDRVNSELGYTYDNLVACCMTCNRCKGNRPMAEFLDWITQIYRKCCNVSVSPRCQ